MKNRSKDFFELMKRRRTVRDFSDKQIPKEVLDNIIATAGTAPSGANKQPWSFCLVTDPGVKRKIREEAEKEEFENYHGRMGDRWLDDLKHLGTDHIKEFLEIAPALIIIFKRIYEYDDKGGKHNNYYVNESVGIAVGMLLAALQNVGLVAVTHTPSPMNFLAQVLERPENERAFLLIPVGYPAEEARVPDIKRKSLNEIRINYG
ncbi:MAG: nitroreductase family protein [Flavobacteriales bacterium]|nr:nitroreductase family protein [Flavobacteriales bacterium]